MSFETLPKERLARTPTPLHEATRLRDALGGPKGCPRILFKRDDLTDLAFGGNKARKLEFILGDARVKRATVLITTGGPQSNHARMTAAAARLCGMKAMLILSGPGPRGDAGNLLLDRLLGAEIRTLDASLTGPAAEHAEATAIADAVRELEARGEKPYVVSLGGSDPLGTLGYVVATREMLDQLRGAEIRPNFLYHASGSRGTQAGLELGTRVFEASWKVVGIAVSPGEEDKRRKAARLIHDAGALIGREVLVREDELHTDVRYYGDGYAAPTAHGSEAIELVARTEGVFLDPVYTGKAMAGLIDHIRNGLIGPSQTVIFLHTGGAPGLFAIGA